MTDHNIITFPTCRAPEIIPHQPPARGANFSCGERVSYRCTAMNCQVEGTILQIQLDPLSGAQWRALIQTDFMNTWRNAWEIRRCR